MRNVRAASGEMRLPSMRRRVPTGTRRETDHGIFCDSPRSFCPGCGRAREDGDAAVAPTTAEMFAPAAQDSLTMRPAAPRSRRSWVTIGLSSGALLIAGVAVAWFLVGGTDATPKASAAAETSLGVDWIYQAKLKTIVAPVVHDNERLSNSLARLRGTKATNAKAEVSRAKRATTLAQGATSALVVPSGSRELATAAEQFLDREAAYLSAVAAVLASPRNSSASEIRTLQSNLTSAIIAAAPIMPDASKSVSGAGALVGWSGHAKKTLAKRASARARAKTPAVEAPTAAAASPVSAGTSCDQNISVGGGATCAFGSNVFWGYWVHTSRGDGTVFTAWSPSASMIMTASCSGTAPVRCTTANGGVITFPIGAVNAYNESAASAYARSHDLGPDPYS
jgi:hypothetical protein